MYVQIFVHILIDSVVTIVNYIENSYISNISSGIYYGEDVISNREFNIYIYKYFL